MNRKIFAHVGPTNSGKTYTALERLREPGIDGIYCSPLRLLAFEVYDRLNDDGIATNLLTGQEIVSVEGARLTSCTTEMAGIDTRYDVAVVDEMQLIGSEDRGWAWTRALLGLPAKEIHSSRLD